MGGNTYGRCKGCGAQVIWVKTKNGKNMPCDPNWVRYKKIPGGKERVVTDQGEVLACTTDVDLDDADGFGYISHFASCRRSVAFHRKTKARQTIAV